MQTMSLGRSQYFVRTFDQHCGFSLVRLINGKSETGSAGIEMITEMENSFYQKTEMLKCVAGNIVKWLRSDGGGEYIRHHFQNWLKQ